MCHRKVLLNSIKAFDKIAPSFTVSRKHIGITQLVDLLVGEQLAAGPSADGMDINQGAEASCGPPQGLRRAVADGTFGWITVAIYRKETYLTGENKN